MQTVLEIKNLKAYFETKSRVVRAVDGVDLVVKQGETVGIVGESGCGKTALSLAIMGLLPTPPAKIISGSIFFEGTDLLSINNDAMRNIRGGEIAMVFQEPMSSLNPVISIGEQVAEVLRLHLNMNAKQARSRTIEIFELVGLSHPAERFNAYAHQLSGGMRQRVMIAIAISCQPRLIIADEPTTALDVTIQAQIMELLSKIKNDNDTALILISHDLSLVSQEAQQIAIMYAGRIVETGLAKEVLEYPFHPYTKGLLNSLPKFEDSTKKDCRLKTIRGVVPQLSEAFIGCAFSNRCEHAIDQCKMSEPCMCEKATGRFVRCWL
ncbi:MAG: ABC transporter ATP-binding protein [Deltaproteobacteria bacterium]